MCLFFNSQLSMTYKKRPKCDSDLLCCFMEMHHKDLGTLVIARLNVLKKKKKISQSETT